MKLKTYFDKSVIQSALNERKMTLNFTWDKYIPWLFGFYELKKKDWSTNESGYEQSESNIFKLLLMPFKL